MARESLKDKRRRAERIYKTLNEHYPEASCTLVYTSAWELLVGGILAAQCTDERVNQVTAVLFDESPTIEDVAALPLHRLEEQVRTCGLYRNKAKNIKASAIKILEDFDGKVPQGEKELLSLPGVGRKIMNLVQSDYFGVPAMVVDTHNGRISRDLGLTNEKDPSKVEAALKKLLAPEHWTHWGHLIVHHGRVCCKARAKTCLLCPVSRDCRFALRHEAELSKALAEGDMTRAFKDRV